MYSLKSCEDEECQYAVLEGERERNRRLTFSLGAIPIAIPITFLAASS